MKRCLALVALVAACSSDDDVRVPVRAAPASRHAAVETELGADAHAYAFDAGDWLEDAGEAPFYGVGWLARRAQAKLADASELARLDAALVRATTLLAGEANADSVMATLGVIEYTNASRDTKLVPVLDGFLDRLDAQLHAAGDFIPDGTPGADLYGTTALTALIGLVEAQAALYLNESARIARVRAIDGAIVARAFGDLADAQTGTSARGYAFAPGVAGISDLPNLAMVLLKARLFRLTKDEAYRVEARAVFSALQSLKLGDVPARYTAAYARPILKTDSRSVVTLASAGYVALALLFMFEITGEQRFVDEADRAVDGIAAMRTSYCAGTRCATGLVDTLVDGQLGTTFDAGANFEALYILGYRRMLAEEAY